MRIRASLLCLLFVVPFGLAQETDPEYVPTYAIEFDLEFAGGDLQALAEAVEEAIGQPAGIVFADEASRTFPAPTMRLARVTTRDLAEVLKMAQLRDESGNELEVSFGAGVVVLRRRDRSPVGFRAIRVRLFSVAPYLGSYEIDEIVTVIETAWEMADPASSANLRFHPGTELLLAAGTEVELMLVREVLESLAERPRGKIDFVPEPAGTISEIDLRGGRQTSCVARLRADNEVAVGDQYLVVRNETFLALLSVQAVEAGSARFRIVFFADGSALEIGDEVMPVPTD